MVGRHGRFDNGEVDRQRVVRWDVILTADRDPSERIATMDARDTGNPGTASKTCDRGYATDFDEISPFHI
jgi:hypothetical protein